MSASSTPTLRAEPDRVGGPVSAPAVRAQPDIRDGSQARRAVGGTTERGGAGNRLAGHSPVSSGRSDVVARRREAKVEASRLVAWSPFDPFSRLATPAPGDECDSSAVARRMAEAIVEEWCAGEAVDEVMLVRRGFRAAQVIEHGQAACALAHERLDRQDGHWRDDARLVAAWLASATPVRPSSIDPGCLA